MIKETSGDSYETARSLDQNLTFDKSVDFFKKRKIEFGKAQMRTLHLIGGDGMIKLAVFEGSKKSVFKDRRELSGSLLEQMEEAFDYIDRYNRTRAEFSGLDRLDMRDYPPEAIREALLNAIVHRDYSFSSAALISIFEDRIEFVTIGGLVKGITLDDVKLGVSVLRNQNLANIFYRLRLIEAYGTGILKIDECYEDYAVKPIIETTSNAFKITLPNTNFCAEEQKAPNTRKISGFTSMTKKEERINAVLKLCRSKGSIVRSDIEMELGVSQSTAILLLRELTDDGVLIKKGKTRNLRYYENK